MDYLSGKSNSANNDGNVDVHSKPQKKHESNFVKLSKAMLACLSSDEQATISEKYLTPEIVSVMQDKEHIDCINAFITNN